ncbi:hypothetical protein [Arthrobacter sp. efr-133-R2A-63]|uniref:hypothetical protein n=1 Tax=Arthrobacter sp. efr-133-R2A-63 TaxID=3040278 RepID=UPI00254B12E8|nr:hypothetical protein [Arthrobacter sp. efr-133-R2A-63]
MKLTPIDASRARQPAIAVLSDFEIGQHVGRHRGWLLDEDGAVYEKKSGLLRRPQRVAESLVDLGRILRTLPNPAVRVGEESSAIYWGLIPNVHELQRLRI